MKFQAYDKSYGTALLSHCLHVHGHDEQIVVSHAEWLRIIRPGGLILNYDAEHALQSP